MSWRSGNGQDRDITAGVAPFVSQGKLLVLCLLSVNITGFSDPCDPLVQASFPPRAQGLKNELRSFGPPGGCSHRCTHQILVYVLPKGAQVHPSEMLPLCQLILSHPSGPRRAYLFHAASMATPALRTLCLLGQTGRGLDEARLGSKNRGHSFSRVLIPSPFKAQGQCSLHSPLFCMVRSPASDPSHHTNMLLLLPF